MLERLPPTGVESMGKTVVSEDDEKLGTIRALHPQTASPRKVFAWVSHGPAC